MYTNFIVAIFRWKLCFFDITVKSEYRVLCLGVNYMVRTEGIRETAEIVNIFDFLNKTPSVHIYKDNRFYRFQEWFILIFFIFIFILTKIQLKSTNKSIGIKKRWHSLEAFTKNMHKAEKALKVNIYSTFLKWFEWSKNFIGRDLTMW